MYLCIIMFPLFSFFITNLLGRFIGVYISSILSTVSIFLSLFLSIFLFYEIILYKSICQIYFMTCFNNELLSVIWGFNYDPLSVIMLNVVCFVSAFVHLYSIEYMSSDPHQGRFMGYLSLFTFFMLILIVADNFVLMFFGWEGIGLSSYLLINFWSTRFQAGKSAIKAMVVNRIGDLGLILGISFIFLTYKSLDYAVVFALSSCVLNSQFLFLSFDLDRLTLITALLFIGVMGKSAQIGLHTWLPDAMEAPSPVSALLHAATLVTAGVILIIRCSFLFELSPSILIVITIFGSLTALFGATIGLVQNDLKRVIAYSTCSQLGYMIFACGISHYSIALFHLFNHALFKSLLFLGAGSIIHGLSDEQDIRKMAGIIKSFPISSIFILVGSIALTGIPFFSGFYSKDIILEIAFSGYNSYSLFAYFLGCIAAGCTSFYSWRLFYLTFVNYPNSYKVYLQKAHEPGFLMLVPLFFLCFATIFAGYIFKDMFSGLGTPFFQASIFTFFKSTTLDSEFLYQLIKILPLIFTLFGFFFSFCIIYSSGKKNQLWSITNLFLSLKLTTFGRNTYRFLSKKWHFDQIFNELLTHKIMTFGYRVSFQILDKGNIEKYCSLGFSSIINDISKTNINLNNGFLFHYSFIILLVLLLFIAIVLLNFVDQILIQYFLLFVCYILYLTQK